MANPKLLSTTVASILALSATTASQAAVPDQPANWKNARA